MKVSEWVTGLGETTVDVLCTGLSKKDELVLQSQSWIYVGETGRKEMPELKKRGSSHTSSGLRQKGGTCVYDSAIHSHLDLVISVRYPRKKNARRGITSGQKTKLVSVSTDLDELLPIPAYLGRMRANS